MTKRLLLGLGIAATLFAGPALAQLSDEAYPADEMAAMGAAPAYSAGDLAAILQPSMKTRSLSPGTGPEPGAQGSGVVPDLQIHFEFNSAELTEQARLQLDQLGEALNKDSLLSYSFQIGGHTDSAGSDVYNEWLSEERAKSVVAYLAEQHQVDPGRLEPIGFGERELFDPDEPRGAVNRRVEVRTLQ